MQKKIGILGVGMVGSAYANALKDRFDIVKYDKFKMFDDLDAINKCGVIFICVPTEYDDKINGYDLSCIDEAFENITGEKIIIIKSTVLLGTTECYQKKYPQHKILFCPEFLTEETAVNDASYPDRTIVGYTDKSFDVAGDILQILPLAPFSRILPSTEAEMIKLMGNTWFSIKVIFANEIYDLCKRQNIDYNRVKESVAADKRIGRTHLDVLHKGYRGYGGGCLPKDTKALIGFAKQNEVEIELLNTAERINNKLKKTSKRY
jgi:UDPglucose 6-dehydrogenase